MWNEFRQFINRGNVIDLAVAVIIGAAFNSIVASLVDDLIMPLIGILLGGVDFTTLVIQVGDAALAYGNLIQAIINFLVIAFVMFLIVRSYSRFQKQEALPAPSTRPCPFCTTDIPLKAIRCPHCTSSLQVATATQEI
jgi:large conductance mechanosensitive channel